MSDDLVNPETHFIAYSLGKLDARVLPVGDPVPAEYYETHLPSLLAEFDECLPTGDAEVATLLVVAQATRIQELEAEVERLIADLQNSADVMEIARSELEDNQMSGAYGILTFNISKRIPNSIERARQSLGDSNG